MATTTNSPAVDISLACSGVRCLTAILALSFAALSTAVGLPQEWAGAKPEVFRLPQSIGSAFEQYVTVLTPDKNEAEWWAGAPSVLRDRAGTFWLAARLRSPEHPVGLRGYEIRLLKSEDGLRFHPVRSIHRAEIPIPGFERPALVVDPRTHRFKLYVCGPWQNGPWCILKFDDVDRLEDINTSTARPVIQAPERAYPRDVSVREYKDPVILHAHGQWHCFVTGYIRQNERIFHFTSPDAEAWNPVGDVNQPVMELTNWHNFFVRPASVLPLGVGFLFVYEGSSSRWYDPVYNVLTGLAFTFDLEQIQDLSPEAPLFKSSTPGNEFHTWRYSHWLWVEEEIWVYAEVANERQAHEIRLFRLPRNP
jgi:hypothetical protein